MRFSLAALATLAALAGFAAHPAHAIVAIPVGTAVGTAIDTFAIGGVYAAPLPAPLAQPFAAPDFTITFSVPAEVSTSFLSPFPGFLIRGVAGTYSNAGQTETFTNAEVSFSTGNGTSNIDVGIAGLLQTDVYTLSFITSTPIITSLGGDGPPSYSFIPGGFTITSGAATYSVDPGFTGSGTVTPAATVPEPVSAALLLPALAMLGMIRRSRRSSTGLA